MLYKTEKKYGGYQGHPLYKRLLKLHMQNILVINYDAEHPAGFAKNGEEAITQKDKLIIASADEIKENEEEKDENDLIKKRQKPCDYIFAHYLDYVSRRVKKEYYLRVLKFIFSYRECMNRVGERLNEEKKLLPTELFPELIGADLSSEEYCMITNAEQVPDASNDLLTSFLPKVYPEMILEEAIQLTQNLAYWLFINGYTCSKLSLIQ